MKTSNTNSLAHTTWDCKYHLVFAPKFRRQIIYRELRADIGKILRELCASRLLINSKIRPHPFIAFLQPIFQIFYIFSVCHQRMIIFK